MKAKCCEKCGKELGFLDFKREIKNDRLDLHYDCLCVKCSRIVNDGIESLDSLYNNMIAGLREHRRIPNMAAVDLDTLIFQAVETIFSKLPDYDQGNTKIHQALINSEGHVSAPEEELCKIVEYLIDYGFAINKKNARVIDFREYFKRSTKFCDQVGINRKEAIPKSYCHLFLSCRGLIGGHMETGEAFSLPIEENTEFIYEEINDSEILITSMSFPEDNERNVHLYPLNAEQFKVITKTFDLFNATAKRRLEYKRREMIASICRNIYKDLKKIKSDEKFSQIPIDCLLIFIVKNIMGEPEARKSSLFDENSLLMDILFEQFFDNLVLFGRTDRSDVLDYIRKNTLLTKDFYIQYDKQKEKAWGFFTIKGYILCFLESRKFVYVFDDQLPNDIYYPCNDLVYKGCRYLQLSEKQKSTEGSGNFRNFDGLIFFSKDIEKMGEMNRFFNLNSILYVMGLYTEAEDAIYNDREALLEVKRVSDKLFGEFSYLPFCQYDEWAAILEKLKEDDFLLRQIIDKKTRGQKYSPANATSYTIRIIKAFNRCARELENTLHFGDLSITKAILWGYFSSSLIDTLSREWIRVAGDIVRDGDSLVDAFSKYFNMAEIDSNKSYYLGLYVYYLMSRNILPEDDFLENYERCVPVFQKYNKVVEDIRVKRVINEHAKPAAEPVTEHFENTKASEEKKTNPKRFGASSPLSFRKIDLERPVTENEKDLSSADTTPFVISDVYASYPIDKSGRNDAKTNRYEPSQNENHPVGSAETGSEAESSSQEMIKKASEILAEKAAKAQKNEKPVRRIIDNEV